MEDIFGCLVHCVAITLVDTSGMEPAFHFHMDAEKVFAQIAERKRKIKQMLFTKTLEIIITWTNMAICTL